MQPPPIIAVAPQLPLIVVTPPPNPVAPGGQFNPGLEAILEENEEDKEEEVEPRGAVAPPLPPLPPPPPLIAYFS